METDPDTFVDACIQTSFLPNIILALQASPSSRPDAVVPLVDCLGLISYRSEANQDAAAQVIGLTEALATHFSGNDIS